jgi:hypothetical protein
MKEYIGEDGIPVVEYELEDIPKLKSGELLNVFGLWNTAPKSEGGGSTLFKLSIEAQAFCDAEKEDEKLTYWEKVDSRLEAAIKSFQEVLKRSPAPPETIANRIRQAKWTLNPDNDPNAPFELGIKPNAHLKEAWQNLTKGIIVYSIHNYHNNQLKAHVENLFLQWLKTLQANPEPVTEPVTPPQDKEGSTGAESEQKQGLSYPNTALALAYERISVTTKEEALQYGANYREMTVKNAATMLLRECPQVFHAKDRLAALDEFNNKRPVSELKKRMDIIKPVLSETAKPLLEQELGMVNEYLEKLRKRTF